MNDTGLDTVEAVYEAGKQGQWALVARAFAADGMLGGMAARYQKPTSGWTLLHQAAYWRDRDAARLCLHYGAAPERAARGGETPAQVAAERGDDAMAEWLRGAVIGDGLWRTVADPQRRASSNRWDSLPVAASVRTASADFSVAYGGGRRQIRKGQRYYVDAWERVLVGWHGSVDPPCGMDDLPMIDV